MNEYVKFNCHVMKKNNVGEKTPQDIMSEYIVSRKNNSDYIFDGIECTVVSVKWASGRTGIITDIIRTDDFVKTYK